MSFEKYLTEQVIEGETTRNNGHTHKYRVDAIGTGFTTFDNTKHIHSIGVWKCKTSAGHEHDIPRKVSEASQSFVLQEYLFGWYDIQHFNSLKDAQQFAEKRYKNILKRNKKAKKDWRPNAYGSEQIHPVRVVDKSSKPFKYYPGTTLDKKEWDKNKKHYLQEKRVYADVYQNPSGEIATVQKDGKGFYIEVDNKYDLDMSNKKALNKWIKDGDWRHIGVDKVYEAIKYVKKPDFMVAMGQEPEYLVKEISPDVYQLAKFTHGKEPTEVYRCQWTGKSWKCNCYSRKGSCKHIDHVQKFIKGKKKSVFDKWANKVLKL
jgi:hypothetical protein